MIIRNNITLFQMMESMNAASFSCCSFVILSHLSRISDCPDGSLVITLSFSKKNWDNVIPKALHICSKEDIEGVMLFLYQEETVEYGSPACFAS